MNSFVHSAIIRKIKLMTMAGTLLCLLFSPFVVTAAQPDTTWSVSFTLNMSKAVDQHIFLPDSDYVYLIMDQGITPLKLVAGPDYVYTGVFDDLLDSGVTYNYKFRINDSVWETVNRTLTAKPGIVNVTAWWNNDPLNITTFIVNMEYAVQYGLFNPASDSVSIAGTMNGTQGPSRMQRIDTTLNYSWVDTVLVPGSVQQYKYRINQGDTASNHQELLFRPNRIVRIPDTLLTVKSDFNNFNPAKRLMTFHCDMGYFVKAHHFNVASDYLDVAGDFNGSGANDVLFDTDGDTVYSVDLYLDTTWIHPGPISFKFRINGNWNSAELAGKPDRTYYFHDTINQNPNNYFCFYNDLNPSVPTRPWADDLNIQGLLIHKKILSGSYVFENLNGIPEGNSAYRWLRSNNAQGTDATAIDSANKITYVVDTLDIGKWIVFEVTPIALSGDSATGDPMRVVSTSSISAWDVGMGEYARLITRIFPNPASDYITVEAGSEIYRIELFNSLNQSVLIKEGINAASARLPVGYLPKGFYILKAVTRSGLAGTGRVIKL